MSARAGKADEALGDKDGSASLRSVVAHALDAAAAAWPGVRFLPLDVLVHRIAEQRRLGAAKSASIEHLHLSDWCLACACAAGEPKAMHYVETHFLKRIDGFVRKVDPSPAFADEVRQLVREKIFFGGGDLHPKIAEYTGAGPFEGWLRVVAIRTAQNVVRTRKPSVPIDQADLPLDAMAPDPELAFARTHAREAFRAAFEEAMGGLSSEERTMLRLHYLDGLTSSAIGEMFAAASATIRRRIEASRQKLLRATRRALTERLHMSPPEVDHVLLELQSNFDLSLSRLLRNAVASP